MRDRNLERLLSEIKKEPTTDGLTPAEKEFFVQIEYLKERDYRTYTRYLNKYIEITKKRKWP